MYVPAESVPDQLVPAIPITRVKYGPDHETRLFSADHDLSDVAERVEGG